MLRKFTLVVIFFVSLSSQAFSQAKVGTTGALFLELSPAVKANGMGEAGVALVSNESMYFNPGGFGLYLCENKISVSGNYIKLPADIKIYGSTNSFPINYVNSNSITTSGFGYYLIKTNSGEIIERDYNNGTIEGTGNTFSWNNIAHNFVYAHGYSGVVDFGVGITGKYIRESVHDYLSDGWAIDFGFIIGKKIIQKKSPAEFLYSFRPLLGLSINNFGPDLTMLLNSYPLPCIYRLGLSFEYSIIKYNNGYYGENIFSIIQAVELQKNKFEDNTILKAGLETSFVEVVSLRLGWRDYNTDALTYGFSLSSKGILNLLLQTDGKSNLFYDKLDIEYSYAKKDSRSSVFDVSYHSLGITYNLNR